MKFPKQLSAAFIIIASLILLTNNTFAQDRQDKVPDQKQEDPNDVPRDISLYQPAPVLKVVFSVTPNGYELVSSEEVMGGATESIVKSRPVRITGYDDQEEPLSVVSKLNPLEVHTAGADDPDSARLEKATLTVFFDNPDKIRSVKVEVFENGDITYEETFEVRTN